MKTTTVYVSEAMTVNGRAARISVRLDDYLEADELARIITAGLRITPTKRAAHFKTKGISDLSITFAPSED